ncbi:MAG: 1-acyl-sn-glycerol-3-phosphate acyltransferase [Acidobacteria bacterium]|nr:1-acyl-sn-glycerol-3-phosphate acyltransferase [Acidobacteriota bacterium]
MTSTITLPLWAAAALLLFSLLFVLDRLFVPGLRWYLRRKVNRALEEVNTRLRIRIQPFKLTKRRVLIDRLRYDPAVMEAVESEMRESGAPRDVVMGRIGRYAREIVPAFNAYFYFRIGTWLARSVARSLYRVRLGYSDEAKLATIPDRSTIVFVMNHRSNMDYILVSYLAAERTALSYAVGEWARVWPLQTLIRATGAYFVRRNSRNPLYRRVLERYVAMATAGGVTQAVYPEGRLSRDGKLGMAKLGLLDYMLRSFDPGGDRDIVFVPVGINYDRVLEDRSLLLDTGAAAPRPGALASAGRTAAFVLRNLSLIARSKWHRFGYACVNFGPPVSLKEHMRSHNVDFRGMEKERRFEKIGELAGELMHSIARVIPVLPVSLVATVFVDNPEDSYSELEMKDEVVRLMRSLEAGGAHIYVPRGDQDYAISVGLRMLTLRRLLLEENGLFTARKSEIQLLRYYANSVAHLPRAGRPDSSPRL